MKAFVLITMMLGFCSCADSHRHEDNSRIPPTDNSIGIRFINEAGNDASGQVEMKLVRTENEDEFYEMPPTSYSYRCLIDGTEVPLIYYIDEEPVNSIIKLEITKQKSEKVKTFCLILRSTYAIYKKGWHSDELYEFDYRFKIPDLLGNNENSLKITIKAKNLSRKIYERVTFNGEDLTHNNGNLFTIYINNQSKNKRI